MLQVRLDRSVTHAFSAAAQHGAATYWTPSRMARAAHEGAASTANASTANASTANASTANASTVRPQDNPTPPPGIPSPVYFNGIKTVGALFFTTGTQNHFCTASVVDSITMNLVLTAAHCVAHANGTFAQNVVYVPEWHNGISPYGMWPVQTITVTSSWGGGPWILGLNPVTGSGIVFGDIGGFDEGGDFPWASYSSYYDATIRSLWFQAQQAQRTQF